MKQLLFIFLIMLNACTKTHNYSKDDKLSFSKIPYNGIELKTSGYFYTKGKDNDFSGANFIYSNGIILNIGGSEANQIDFEIYINNVSNNNWAKNSKSGWGLFKIDGSTFYYERWYPKPFGGFYKVFSRECDILNDSTFVLKKQYRLVNGAQTEVTFPNQTYHFVAFANKPSSDNNFIP